MAKKSGSFIFIIIAILAGMFFLAWILLSSGEPRYQGKTLSYWMGTSSHGGSQKQRGEAQAALRAMGGSAVPFLVHIVEKEDAPIKIKLLRDYGRRFPILNQWLRLTTDDERVDAERALGEIGAPASNALPTLLAVIAKNPVSHSEMRWAAKAAVMKIKGEPIDGLLADLDKDFANEFMQQWLDAAMTLAEFGTNAASAIPALCRVLVKRHPLIAVNAIGLIHGDPEIAVPTLLKLLKDDKEGTNSSFVLSGLIWALGQYEGDARQAIPLLREELMENDPFIRQNTMLSLSKILPAQELPSMESALLAALKDTNSSVRMSAGILFKQIDPAAAKKAGVE